jgi:hypothetical protein
MKFFVIVDFTYVHPLKATSYDEAFEEIENVQGHTWVCTENNLRELIANAKEELK